MLTGNTIMTTKFTTDIPRSVVEDYFRNVRITHTKQININQNTYARSDWWVRN